VAPVATQCAAADELTSLLRQQAAKPSFAVLTQISRNQTVRRTSESFLAACYARGPV